MELPSALEGERLLRVALWSIRGISARAIDGAIAAFGSLEEACRQPRPALAEAMGLRPGGRGQLLAAPADLAGWSADRERGSAARGGRHLLRGDDGYPDLGTLGDPPEVLWLRGELGGAGTLGADGLPRAVAVVGARRADPGAIRMARCFGAALAGAGYTVVSGGALGIDAAAHEGALEGGGPTVAVLGSGILRPLPASNRRLFARMLVAGGGLVSELPAEEPARAEHFPRRNRLIAAMARAVVVVRAGAGSGSLYTATAMSAQRRAIFVLPADPGEAAAGGEALLAAGALPVRSPAELLERLGGEVRRSRGGPPLDAEDGRLLAAIDRQPSGVAEVAARLGAPLGDVAARLADLCARGLARPAGPGRFIRT